MSLRFDNPQFLWGLVLLALFSYWVITQRRSRPFDSMSLILNVLALSACILGLARPQMGYRNLSTKQIKSQIFLAIDVSQSMSAKDVLPSRLGFSVAFASQLASRLGAARLAIFPFAADGYLLLPLTNDPLAQRQVLAGLSPLSTTQQGSNIGIALNSLLTVIIQMERSTLERRGDWISPKVILISDGESHTPVEANLLDQFAKRRIPIFSVGVGTKEGAPLSVFSRFQAGPPLRDPTGKPVYSRLDTKLLRRISGDTGASYFPGRFEEIANLEKALMTSARGTSVVSHFQTKYEFFPLLFSLAIVLFSLEVLRGRWEYVLRIIVLIHFSYACSSAFANDSRKELTEQLRSESNPNRRSVILFNLGVAYLEFYDPIKAAEQFQEAALISQDPQLKKKALFNLGNVLLRLQEPAQALTIYQQARDNFADPPEFNTNTNQKLSENMELASRIIEQQKLQKSGQGQSQGDTQPQAFDPKGPQKHFESQPLSDDQKQKIFDQMSNEELQTRARLEESRYGKKGVIIQGKPW